MKQLITFIMPHQQKVFYLFLILLLISGAILPALAQNTTSLYKTYVDEATVALDKGDTRAAYSALAKARKAARKNSDKEQQEAFRECLKKIPVYEAYIPLIKQAEQQLAEEDLKNAQSSLLAAREQLDLAIAIAANNPDFIQYEKNKRLAVENRIAEIEAHRLPLLEKAIELGEDKFLEGLPGEALEQFNIARDLAVEQANENRKFRIGERIQKAELHYDIYTQLNLGRREAGYRRYRQAQLIFQDALAKIEQSREYYFPRLENVDTKQHLEIEKQIEQVNTRRTKTYEIALQRGQDYLEKDQPEEAMKAFSYAKQQMFEEQREYQTTGVDQYIDQAHYSLLVKEGDELLKTANYPDAIVAYQEAQSKIKTEEIAFKLEQTKENAYQDALVKGRQAFSQGNYEEAQLHYQTAATFKNSPELNGLLTQHYQDLLMQGQQKADIADYAQAKVYFENARLFSDTPEIQQMIGDVEGGLDYETAYIAGTQYLRDGRIEDARESFEQARKYKNSVEVQDQLFAIEDYQLAVKEGRNALNSKDTNLARAYFQNAQDIFNTPEVNDWIRQTGSEVDQDRMAVQSYESYNTQPILASSRTLTAKGIGSGRIDFNFNTFMWMRPDCSANWSVELYNAFGSLTATEKVDSQCGFAFSNLPDGTYTYELILQDDAGQTKTYKTKNNEVVIRNGETVRVDIDAR